MRDVLLARACIAGDVEHVRGEAAELIEDGCVARGVGGGVAARIVEDDAEADAMAVRDESLTGLCERAEVGDRVVAAEDDECVGALDPIGL